MPTAERRPTVLLASNTQTTKGSGRSRPPLPCLVKAILRPRSQVSSCQAAAGWAYVLVVASRVMARRAIQ
jgi:hypothetical protein